MLITVNRNKGEAKGEDVHILGPSCQTLVCRAICEQCFIEETVEEEAAVTRAGIKASLNPLDV
jgi:hypothetical protein